VELSKEKIASLREKVEKKNSVFKDKRYLDSLFLPSKIIGREKQAEQLIQYIDSLKQGLLVPVISVYGRSGAGKSTVVRFVCQNMSDILSFSFVNLRKAKTVFGCSNLILSELGSENLKSAQGLNKAIECMESNIEKILADEKKKFFVLILDEYDVIFSDPRGRPSDFVYKLLTLEENLREKGLWLCIITISNNALSEHELDDRVKSRIGNSEIFFDPYRQEDVFNILQDRAKKAFAKKVGIDVLRYCAKLSSDDHGDARRALDLLRISGELSDGKKLTTADVEKAVELLQKDRVATIVTNSSYHMRLVIGAICSISLLSGNPWCATSVVYKKYCLIISKEFKPLSYRRIVDLLVEVENSGLVVSRTISRGRHGYGNEYKLKLSPDLVGPSISSKWWESVVKKKRNDEEMEERLAQLKSMSTSSPFARSLFRSSNLLKKYSLDL
jgi:cell division control protein 6